MNGGRIGSLNLPNGASASGVWSLREHAMFTAARRWPNDFPKTISGIKLWFAAHRLTGLNDGDAVGTWPDLSGNGYDVTQATAANKPLYKTNIFNGQPALLFDGTNDYLENTTVNPFTAGAARTVFIFARGNSGTSGTFIAFRRTARCWVYQFYVDASNFGLFFTDGVSSSNFSLATLGIAQSPAALTVRAPGAGAVHKARFNGQNLTVTGNNPIAEAGSTGFYIGRREIGSQFLNGYIAEIIAYDSELSDATCLQVEQYLAAKYMALANP